MERENLRISMRTNIEVLISFDLIITTSTERGRKERKGEERQIEKQLQQTSGLKVIDLVKKVSARANSPKWTANCPRLKQLAAHLAATYIVHLLKQLAAHLAATLCLVTVSVESLSREQHIS